MNRWNRWAIVEGWYWWLADHHGGQSSREYQRLSKISRYYRPGILSHGPGDEESQEVYDRLCEKHGCLVSCKTGGR